MDDKTEQVEQVERLSTYKKTSEVTGLEVGTLYQLVHQGRIPHVRLGRRFVRFRLSEVKRWLDEHAVGVDGSEAGQ